MKKKFWLSISAKAKINIQTGSPPRSLISKILQNLLITSNVTEALNRWMRIIARQEMLAHCLDSK